MCVSSSSEATEEQPPTQPAVTAAPTVIQPAVATTDSLIGDLLSLDLPSAPPTQYDQFASGTAVCCHGDEFLWLCICVGCMYTCLH